MQGGWKQLGKPFDNVKVGFRTGASRNLERDLGTGARARHIRLRRG